MEDIREKFKIPDVSTLRVEQIAVLKKISRTGEKHLKYFYSTMEKFRFPEKRVKCQDTVYYEEVLPIVAGILREHEALQLLNKKKVNLEKEVNANSNE